MLTLEQAATFLGDDTRTVQRLTNAGAVHFTYDSLPDLLICLHRLWAARANTANGPDLTEKK